MKLGGVRPAEDFIFPPDFLPLMAMRGCGSLGDPLFFFGRNEAISHKAKKKVNHVLAIDKRRPGVKGKKAFLASKDIIGLAVMP